MKKFLSLLTALVMICVLLIPSASAAGKSDDLVVLYTNDVHCQVDQVKDSGTGAVTNIGYAGVAALKKEMQNNYNNVVLVDSGDHLQGGPIGTLSKGSYIVDIMNYIGYEYSAVGNHEFDYGMDKLLTNIKSAQYQYLSCNFTKSDGSSVSGVKSYEIKEYNGLKVAFIGISTPESFTKSTPTYFQDKNGNYLYSFAEGGNGHDLYDKVQKTIDAAKADGAEYIIALSHLVTDTASSPLSSKDVIAHTSGLDAVLDAHSHSTIASEKVNDKNGRSVLLSSTGTKLAAVGKLVVDTTNKTAEASLITGYSSQDPQTLAYISGIEAQYNKLLSTVVAHSDVDLTTKTPDGTKRAVRTNETNLGDLCADAYRIQLGADIAIINGGGIRADIPAGDITYGQIINVQPFGNEACMAEATGQQILDALEMSSRSYPEENGGFLQVSGLTYNIDPSVASTVETDSKGMFVKVNGARRVGNVKVLDKTTGQYVPLDPSKTYKLASYNYLLKSGGNGFNMFQNDRILVDSFKLDNQLLIDYMKDDLSGNIGSEYSDPSGQGRITVKVLTKGTDTEKSGNASSSSPDTRDAGGTVSITAAGIAALAGIFITGKRKKQL